MAPSVAFERFTYDGVDLALHRQQFLVAFQRCVPGNHGQVVAMAGVFAALSSRFNVTQPAPAEPIPEASQERKPK